ncbi:LysR substrate-binding domain-containing protein [Sneathiella marina]|uniref:LysR substrate-binding domain-containing protein n=1 Tax=Sneathiella marina TaxID=2950108 RepID=A0ABY4W5W5_9PROT|nr:LysR family transcriptional regulator [Sneathiella marina]USG62578.1 LysR substrate-binding domain-containing protein [Sneathiella marina]
MDTIDGMRTFVAVAGQRSFTGGAGQLGISTKLASKYVRQLEEHLGAQLFNRTTRTVTLTDTGTAYLERCLPLLDQFDELEGLVQERQSELAGPIRITAPTGFGSRELVAALHPFQKAHSKVTFDIRLSDQHVAIIEEGFDLAIRFGALKDSSLMARKLMDMRLVVIASPKYLSEYGEPRHPSALETHNCLIQLTSADPYNWKFRVDGEIVSFPVDGPFHANSPRAIAHMAVDGAGIGICPHYAVKPFLEDGTLQVLFEAEEATVITLYAVYPPGRHLTARIRALINHLAEAFRA